MTDNAGIETERHPNWAYLLACCAFAVPPGVAIVALYHDTVGMIFHDQNFPVTSFVVHPVVILASGSAFLALVLRWRKFYTMPERHQRFAMWGCWLSAIVGFALCMLLTYTAGQA